MKTRRSWRTRGIVLGVAALLGTSALLAPAAQADTKDDAEKAIADLSSQIQADTADRGFNGSGLGRSEGDLQAVGEGYSQSFTGGTIYWSEAHGAKVLYGAVDAKYSELGGPDGATELGFPTESEEAGPFTPGRQAAFAGEGDPKILWTPEHGAWLVRGPFSLAADKLGADLGAPTGDMTVDGNVVSQSFANGTLNFDAATGQWTSVPASLAAGLAGLTLPNWPNLGLPGLAGLDLSNVSPPNVSAPNVPGADVDTSSTGISPWWWLLLLLIPLLALLWWLAGRRRKVETKTVTHAGRPAAGANVPKVDVKKGAAAAGAAAAVAGGAAAAGSADKVSKGGDGVGTYVRAGLNVPVPVGAHLPLADPQAAPEGYPIKGNAESGLYHLPDQPSYEQTIPEIWFATEGAAKAAGFKPVKNA